MKEKRKEQKMNYYNEIKQELINNEIYKKVKDYSKNRNDLTTYYNVGKIIVKAQGGKERAKYGDGLIKQYSKKLTQELGKGYKERNLKSMRSFYLFIEKGHALNAELSWTHYKELMKLKETNEINYYIYLTIKQKLSYRNLQERIRNKEYERLDEKTKQKLIKKETTKVEDFIKNPIIIKNTLNIKKISEKALQLLILENLNNFLKELGPGFCYIENEYKIKLGNTYNYIDLLLFNIKFNCYVVIELKITELKAEYIGQITKYMGYIDKNIKTQNHNQTIGIIICKKDNQFVVEYTSNPHIFRTIYKIKQ